MSDQPFLESYAGQTTEELIALEGTYRTDSIVLAFEQALDEKADDVGLANLTVEECTVLAVEALEREVNNGGYDQLFANSSKVYVPLLVEALERIGRSDVAALTRKAINALQIDGPLTVESIDDAMDDVDNDERNDALEQCDGEYYDLEGDLADPLLAFIKQNTKRIGVPR